MKKTYTLALLGCPNCGKTTLFNLLTGQTQRTGNWPGVTVQLTKGLVHEAFLPSVCHTHSLEIIDLPGVYALTPHSPDEAVPLTYLKRHPPDAVILVINSCAPAQGLYLALQLMSLRLPMVLTFNMADRLKSLGGKLDLPALEKALHIPCVAISARQGSHVHTLLTKAVEIVHQHNLAPAYHSDSAQARYQFVDQLLSRSFSLPDTQMHPLDRLALHPFFALPMLLLVLFLLFACVFGMPGQTLFNAVNHILQAGVNGVYLLLESAQTPLFLRDLITNGLFGSMTQVLSFLPTLLLFFFITALLEDSGYMARAAFILDGLLKHIGLTGRSFFSLITGYGCSVPAILSTKSLPTRRERLLTALLIPYLPCSAKQPVVLFLCAQCFQGKAFSFILLCYLICTFLPALLSVFLQQKRTAPPLMMELPAYHLPTLRGAVKVMRNKTRDFITRAFTMIFFTAMIIWLLQAFTPALQRAQQAEDSLLFFLSRFIQPLFSPLGFASPYTVSALAAGLLAKENILAVLLLSPPQTLFRSPAAAASFLTFSLLYAPCLASCCALSEQMQSRRRMLTAVLFQTAVAWLAALVIYRLLS